MVSSCSLCLWTTTLIWQDSIVAFLLPISILSITLCVSVTLCVFGLNMLYFKLARYTYKYIQVYMCKRIRTKPVSYVILLFVRLSHYVTVCVTYMITTYLDLISISLNTYFGDSTEPSTWDGSFDQKHILRSGWGITCTRKMAILFYGAQIYW